MAAYSLLPPVPVTQPLWEDRKFLVNRFQLVSHEPLFSSCFFVIFNPLALLSNIHIFECKMLFTFVQISGAQATLDLCIVERVGYQVKSVVAMVTTHLRLFLKVCSVSHQYKIPSALYRQ